MPREELELTDMLYWKKRCSIVGALLLWSSATIANEAPSAVPPEFVTCYGIKQTNERLACYDRAVEYLRQPSEGAGAPSAETSFGLQRRVNEPRKNEAPVDEPEQTTSVTAHVSEVSSNRDGMRVITLDNGQVWRQLTSSTAAFINVGDEVTVTRAALGSFLMRLPNGGPLRVRRMK